MLVCSPRFVLKMKIGSRIHITHNRFGLNVLIVFVVRLLKKANFYGSSSSCLLSFMSIITIKLACVLFQDHIYLYAEIHPNRYSGLDVKALQTELLSNL